MTKIRSMGVITAGVAALAGIAATADAKQGQTVLWNGVRVGMTLAEVKAVIPAATLDGETIIGGDTSIAGAPFKSFVELSGGRAVAVKLVGDGPAASDVMSALNAKYGRPTSAYRCQRLTCSGSWSAPSGVKITLLRWDAALILSYQAVDLSNL